MILKQISLFLCSSLIFSVSIAEDIQLAKLSSPAKISNPSEILKIEQSYSKSSQSDEISSVLKKLEKRLSVYPKDHEAELLKAIVYFKSGKLDLALEALDELIKKVPDFQLAYLLKGDMLLSKFGSTNNLGQTTLLASLVPTLENKKKQKLSFLREEARLRLRALFSEKKIIHCQDKFWPWENQLKKPCWLIKNQTVYMFLKKTMEDIVYSV